MAIPLIRLLILTLAALSALALAACREPADGGLGSGSPLEAGDEGAGQAGARSEIVEMLREGMGREQHPSDGGGRAWLERAEGEPARVTVSTPGRFTIVYEVGPLGIAQGGMIYLQVSPFWGWSTPHVLAPLETGFTEIGASADDIELAPETLGPQLLGIRVAGRPLVEGDRLRITYGAGPAGAITDTYAEKNSRFWIAVDGDGDGSRSILADSPGIDVLPGQAARLHLSVPTIARPGEAVRVTVAVLDALGNAGVPLTGEVALEDVGPGLELPEKLSLHESDRGHGTVTAVARRAGVYRVRARGPGDLSGESNPLVVSDEGPRVLWGDLHGHSALSDGTGTAEDYFLYARDVAGLDVIALTDHDHWGMLPLDENPRDWEKIVEQTGRFHRPGVFVTVLGYEWTSWIHGHRHVLYFDGEGEIHSSVDPEFESPLQLWKALEGRSALTFAHHSAGGPIPVNWEIPPDPRFEPVTEIVSVHGSSEALDSPAVIYSPVAGNFVRDVLDRGYRFGFVGSGDGHDGHPGLAHLAGGAGYGGLAAILSEERTREGVLAALRARRVYATNGPRILLRTALGTHRMGSTIRAPESGLVTEPLFVRVVSEELLERVDLIRSGEVVDSVGVADLRDVSLQRTVTDLRPGEYLYVRAVQEDGGAAWSSPIYIDGDVP